MDFYFLIWGMDIDEVAEAAEIFSGGRFVCYPGQARQGDALGVVRSCVLVEFLGRSDRVGFAAYLTRATGLENFERPVAYPGKFRHNR
jgi:hypothetical protein